VYGLTDLTDINDVLSRGILRARRIRRTSQTTDSFQISFLDIAPATDCRKRALSNGSIRQRGSTIRVGDCGEITAEPNTGANIAGSRHIETRVESRTFNIEKSELHTYRNNLGGYKGKECMCPALINRSFSKIDEKNDMPRIGSLVFSPADAPNSNRNGNLGFGWWRREGL